METWNESIEEDPLAYLLVTASWMILVYEVLMLFFLINLEYKDD